MLSAKKRSLMPRHFVPFDYFLDSQSRSDGRARRWVVWWRPGGMCIAAAVFSGMVSCGGAARRLPVVSHKDWVVRPPPSILRHFTHYCGSSAWWPLSAARPPMATIILWLLTFFYYSLKGVGDIISAYFEEMKTVWNHLGFFLMWLNSAQDPTEHQK